MKEYPYEAGYKAAWKETPRMWLIVHSPGSLDKFCLIPHVECFEEGFV